MAAPVLIAIVGPTASGKSALGLRLALEHGGEIVSCDSLQVYRGLDIGSAKPTRAEQARVVPHHLIDVVDPDEAFTAAEYARRGRKAAGRHPGPRPPAPRGGRQRAVPACAALAGSSRGPRGTRRFAARLEQIADALRGRPAAPAAARASTPSRPRASRCAIAAGSIRALEVFRATGRALSAHHRAGAPALAGFGAGRRRAWTRRARLLRAAVERRTDECSDAACSAEVRGLLDRGYLAPICVRCSAIGYRQAVTSCAAGGTVRGPA